MVFFNLIHFLCFNLSDIIVKRGKSSWITYRQLEYAIDSIRVIRIFDHLGDKQNRFGSVLMQYPKVEFYVAYNGKTPLCEEEKNLFVDLGDIIVKARVIDVRFDNLPTETATDVTNNLSGYSFFVQRFEELKKEGNAPYQAYDLAVEESQSKGYLADIWGRKECVNVFRELFTYEDELKASAWEEGREEGVADTVKNLLEKGFDVNTIADAIKRPVEWIESLLVKA